MAGFEFVNVTNPKEVKQYSSKIRRHVMKDIGKARRKPPRPRDRKETRVIDETLPATETDSTSVLGSGNEAALPDSLVFTLLDPRVDGKISEMVYPFEMNEERLGLIRFMVEEARYVYRPFRFAWLSMGAADQASWNITLANAALFRSLGVGSKSKPEFNTNQEAMKYYNQSFESVTKRLNDPAASNSEQLVVAVVGYVCHDATVGNFERMIMHLKGLKCLIEKRGGLESLNSPFLRLMVSWLDLGAATFLNISPHFKVPKGSITEIDTCDDTKYLDALLQRWDSHCSAHDDILKALKATASVATYINRHSHDPKFWIDDITMARLLGPALHEILSMEGYPLPDSRLKGRYSFVAAREAFRRAALLFLAGVKIRCQAGALELPKHLDAFRQISQLPFVNWTVVPELNLWAHIVAGIQEESPERSWHVTTIVGIMDFLGLRTGAEALGVAKGVIWVDAIMAEKAAALSHDIDNYLLVAGFSQQLQDTTLDPQLDDLGLMPPMLFDSF